MINKLFAPRNNNYFFTLNYTGQYTLPTSENLNLLATLKTDDGDIHIWSAPLNTDWAKPYIEDTLIPYLKETYEQGPGEYDLFDDLPSLRDEALELLYNILPDEEADPYFELIDQIIPDPE